MDRNDKIKYLLKDEKGNLYIRENAEIDGEIYQPIQKVSFKLTTPAVLDMPLIKPSILLRDTENFIKQYVQMPHKEDYLPLALWVAHTYFLDSFNYTPYLYFYGPPTTGKSQAGMSLICLAYFGDPLTSPTESVIFRTAEYYHSSLLIDEIKIFGEGGNPAIEAMLKVRYKRGLYAKRVDTNQPRELDIELFNVFGPVVIASTERLDDTILARSFMFYMQQNY